MGGKLNILLALMFLGLASAQVEISGIYTEGLGFEVNCTWKRTHGNLPYEDITVWRNNDEIISYKPGNINVPEIKANVVIADGHILNYTCNMTLEGGLCQIVVNVSNNGTNDDVYKALSCWEKQKNCSVEFAHIYVKATDTKIVQSKSLISKPTYTCTTAGVPIPKIVWTVVQNNKNEQVPSTSYQAAWNSTSKLWHALSTYKASSDKIQSVTCAARQEFQKGMVVLGSADVFVVNTAGKFDSPGVYAVLLMVFAFMEKSLF